MASPPYQESGELWFGDSMDSKGELNNQLFDEFLNSSCALSPTETGSPGLEYSNDPLGLMEDGFLVDDYLSSPGDREDGDDSPVSSVQTQHSSGGKNLPMAAAKLIKVYPSQAHQNFASDDEESVKSSVRPYKRSKEGKCMNRNAINARENRERKKRYISDLERKVKHLSQQNQLLKGKMSKTDSIIIKLQRELKYTRSILANQGQLSVILGGLMKSSPDLRVRAPHLGMNDLVPDTSMEEPDEETEDSVRVEEIESEEPINRYPKRRRVPKVKEFPPSKPKKKSINMQSLNMDHSYNKRNAAAGGICLHISHDDVSIEMCADCSDSAQLSLAEGS